jgi:hypothetical protein
MKNIIIAGLLILPSLAFAKDSLSNEILKDESKMKELIKQDPEATLKIIRELKTELAEVTAKDLKNEITKQDALIAGQKKSAAAADAGKQLSGLVTVLGGTGVALNGLVLTTESLFAKEKSIPEIRKSARLLVISAALAGAGGAGLYASSKKEKEIAAQIKVAQDRLLDLRRQLSNIELELKSSQSADQKVSELSEETIH